MTFALYSHNDFLVLRPSTKEEIARKKWLEYNLSDNDAIRLAGASPYIGWVDDLWFKDHHYASLEALCGKTLTEEEKEKHKYANDRVQLLLNNHKARPDCVVMVSHGTMCFLFPYSPASDSITKLPARFEGLTIPDYLEYKKGTKTA